MLLEEQSTSRNSDEFIAPSWIDCMGLTVRWPNSSKSCQNNTLTDVTFKVQSGQVLAIIGQVGSGKVNRFSIFSVALAL